MHKLRKNVKKKEKLKCMNKVDIAQIKKECKEKRKVKMYEQG